MSTAQHCERAAHANATVRVLPSSRKSRRCLLSLTSCSLVRIPRRPRLSRHRLPPLPMLNLRRLLPPSLRRLSSSEFRALNHTFADASPAAGVFTTPTQTPEPKTLSVANLSAPVFVPKSSVDSPSASSTPAPQEWANAAPFTPPVSAAPPADAQPYAQQLRPAASQPGLVPPPMGFDEGGMGFDHADGVFLGTAAPPQRRVVS